MSKLKELWNSILEALIRFWDNRFLIREDSSYLLKLELERAHRVNEKLLEKLTNQEKRNESQPVPIEELPKPIGQMHWRTRAQQLTADSIRKRKELEVEALRNQHTMEIDPKAVESIENLEKELGVTENG